VTTTAICPDCLRPLTARHRCPPKKYRVRARNAELTCYGTVGSKDAAIKLCAVLGEGATWEEIT
jgi:hypothetical protein